MSRGFPIDRRCLIAGSVATAAEFAAASAAPGLTYPSHRGFNLIQTPNAPFGGKAAATSLLAARETGANIVALIPFLWQSGPSSPAPRPGSDMTADQLRRGIAQARACGLTVMIKPHMWVPGGWAGQVAMAGDPDWRRWFAAYRMQIVALARIAQQGGAAWFSVGTEIDRSVARPEWPDLIRAVRAVFKGRLLYVAHGAEDAEKVPFWPLLDAVAASLYPVLGSDRDEAGWRRAMRAEIGRLERLAKRARKPIWIGEIGLRSAVGAAARPWESAEERAAAPDGILQARVLATWLDTLRDAAPQGVLVWRWFTDPAGGGPRDTDFTVQGKPAAEMLRKRWR